MNNLRDLINVVLPVIVMLLIALCVVVLVAVIVPVALPTAVIGLIVLVFWLWLRGNIRSDLFKRRRRDYPEDYMR
ncbi:hypothetical protein [Coraliomargarita parva]|uniref:hypothetical protein n=1 Tax=Coraliomargarita parva TaxID=3014050 RepID=UPI0022B3E581|nr:hypothetical protein [Coraliomargarita parva]